MADDKSKKGPADRERVNVHEPHELEHWKEHFKKTKEEIEEAVKKVGVMVKDLTAHFDKSKKTTQK